MKQKAKSVLLFSKNRENISKELAILGDLLCLGLIPQKLQSPNWI